ncbi:MAG: hypothetical protein Q4D56_09505 [Bacteroides sp.]|nr:hypothetical protein [Bacteroides sp.]
MNTAEVKSIKLTIPLSDWSFFKDLAKVRGWKTTESTSRLSGLDKAIEDVKEGRVYHAKDADDLIKQILED